MNALYFKKLTVNSLRGVECFEISEFGEQLNVIYGPNGEGKSLTGKSLQTLIWPKLNSLKDPKLWTEFVIGNDRWEVNLVGDEPDWKLNGHKTDEGPEVPNYGRRGSGIKLKKGLVIAIEPMINMGKRDIMQHSDGWTITTIDKKPSAHFEHTIVVREGEAEILSSFKEIEEILKKNG